MRGVYVATQGCWWFYIYRHGFYLSETEPIFYSSLTVDYSTEASLNRITNHNFSLKIIDYSFTKAPVSLSALLPTKHPRFKSQSYLLI